MRFIIKDRLSGLYLIRRERPAQYGIMNDWGYRQNATVLTSVRQGIRFVSRSDSTLRPTEFKKRYTLVLLNPQQDDSQHDQ